MASRAFENTGMSGGPRRIAIVSAQSGEDGDGIRDYSLRLAETLRTADRDVDVYLRTRTGAWLRLGSDDTVGSRLPTMLAELRAQDAIVLQYNPFMYGRWGFAPWLPQMFRRLRRSSRRPTIAIMVHEPYVPMINWRWVIVGCWQRLQLLALQRSADVLLVSIERWTELFRRRSTVPCLHLAVASALPDRRPDRVSERRRRGLRPHDLVVAAFGTNNPARSAAYIVEAVNALTDWGRRVVLLNLGANPLDLPGLKDEIAVERPGKLPRESLARRLSIADIFLAPYIDGISTRRTTLMAALQHGLAIVGTAGPSTDSIFHIESDAIHLVPVGHIDRFVQAAIRLATHDDERKALGNHARRLYERRFDWPLLADRLIPALSRERQQHRAVPEPIRT